MINQNKNKIKAISIIIIAIFILIGCSMIIKYLSLSKEKNLAKYEKANIDYQVCLKENNYFDTTCLLKDQQYIASLIDYIPIEFNYNFSIPNEKIEYTYTYQIEANFNVLDKDNKKSLFSKSEPLYTSNKITTDNNPNIKYNLDIDYNKYNDLLSNFINLYDLEETVNSLTISMKINIATDNQEISQNKTLSLTIPLTKKTVNIDISGTKTFDDVEKININTPNKPTELLIMGLTLITISLLYILGIVYINNKNKTIKQIYDNRIKKIMNNFGPYIQKINGNYPIGASQICKVATFTDMLEIKDTTDKPLLMLENDNETGSFFIIPVGEGIIYTYALRIEDILAEKEKTIAPDYDIEDINVYKAKPKTYTKKRIKEDIEKTIKLSLVDKDNSIKGTKDNKENLYEQLEKTTTFKILTNQETKRKRSRKKKTKKEKIPS